MLIAQVLREKGSDVIAVRPDTMVQEIAEIIASKRIGAVLVLDGEKHVAGLVSERDVVKAVATRPHGIRELQAHEIMTRDLTYATPDTNVEDAMDVMDQGYFRHLPVTRDGDLVGIGSIRDLVKARIRKVQHEADHMLSYIHGRT